MLHMFCCPVLQTLLLQQALRSFRSSFSQTMSKPQYNCYRIPAGFSKIEPRLNSSQPGYIAGYTDRPNTGPNTIGYSPATDIVTCWGSYSEAAQQAADSRLYGGIHINLDNSDGLKLGRRIGQHVGAVTAKLTAAASRMKGERQLLRRQLVQQQLVRRQLSRRQLMRRQLVRRQLVRRQLVRQQLVLRQLVRRQLVRQQLVQQQLVRRQLPPLLQ
jgi:hypothetical protein